MEDGIGFDALLCVSRWCPNEEITPHRFGNCELSYDLVVVVMGALQFYCALVDDGWLAAKSLNVFCCLQWCQSLLGCCVWSFDLE